MDFPVWLQSRRDYGFWQRNNLWLLYNALAFHCDTTLIALWNGESGDGAGPTQDMITTAHQRGAKVVFLDTRKEFGLG